MEYKAKRQCKLTFGFWITGFIVIYGKKGDKMNITKEDLNPTFLFSWKGTKLQDEKNYHCHDYIELAIILSGKGVLGNE